jgi:hypothetical protein
VFFCKILRFQWFSGFMELFSLRKICRIYPQHRGLDPSSLAHWPTDFSKCQPLVSGSMARIVSSESVSLLGCLDPIGHWIAIGSSQPMQESPGADLTAEVAGSGWGWRQLMLTAVHRGRARRLIRVWVFSSYGGRFLMRFAPTESHLRGECVYANLNRRRATMKPNNGEAARPVLVDGEGGPRWSFGSKDVCQGFLKLPSSFSTDQLLQSVVKNSNFVAT